MLYMGLQDSDIEDFEKAEGLTPKEYLKILWADSLRQLIVPEEFTDREYLKSLCVDGLKRRYTEVTPLLETRLNRELETIHEVDFTEGFLIVHDLVNYAKSNNILIGPGRGSLPGSLVAYCLEITNIDPIKYDLLFERFVNEESAAYINEPYLRWFNIYIDVELGGKQRIMDYVSKKYGPKMPKLLELVDISFRELLDLSIIKDTVGLMQKDTGEMIDVYAITPDDPAVYSYLCSGDNDGILYFDNNEPHIFVPCGWLDNNGDLQECCCPLYIENWESFEIAPRNIDELMAFFSLNRPGLDYGLDTYIALKRYVGNIFHDCPELKSILDSTYGFIVYQEQIMQILQKLGGFSPAQSDSERRNLGKRKLSDFEKRRDMFVKGSVEAQISGCTSKGISEDKANALYENLFDAARYCFNKSHAAAFSYLIYIMAWLKYYHRAAFLKVIENYKRKGTRCYIKNLEWAD